MSARARPAGARVAPAWFTPPRLIMAVFFVQAVSMTNWAPRIPDVQQRLGLSAGELSICLLSMSLGTFVMTIFNGPLIARFSARTMMAIGMCAFCAMLILPGLAWNGPTLFVFLFVMGVSYVIVDVAMNVEAARIQDAVGRRIMSTCHGFWSIGAVVGSVMGGQFAEASRRRLAASAHRRHRRACRSALIAGARRSRCFPPEQAAPAGKRPLIAFPTVALAGVCIYVFGAVLAELSARNWGAAYPARRARHFGRRDRLGPRRLLADHGGGAAGRRPAHRPRSARWRSARICAFIGGRRHGRACRRQRPATGARSASPPSASAFRSAFRSR